MQNIRSIAQVKQPQCSKATLRLFDLCNRETRQVIGIVICKTMCRDKIGDFEI